MPHRYDATLKDIVAEHPADFVEVFGLPANETPTSLNVDLSTISAATDITLGFGKPLRQIVDLNFQTGPDSRLPRRLLLYNTLLQFRHGVPVQSILVLLRPKADSAQLDGKLTYGEGDWRLEFRYRIIRLWQLPVEACFQSGTAALPLAILCKMPADQPLPDAIRSVVLEIGHQLSGRVDPAEAARLMTAAYSLTRLRVPKSSLASIYQGVSIMQELTAYDEAVEEGELRALLKTLLRLGRKKLGTPDPGTEFELAGVKDVERLDRMIDAIQNAESWRSVIGIQ